MMAVIESLVIGRGNSVADVLNIRGSNESADGLDIRMSTPIKTVLMEPGEETILYLRHFNYSSNDKMALPAAKFSLSETGSRIKVDDRGYFSKCHIWDMKNNEKKQIDPGKPYDPRKIILFKETLLSGGSTEMMICRFEVL